MIAAVDSPLGSQPGFQHQACVSSCGAGLKSNKKVFGYPLPAIRLHHYCTEGHTLPFQSFLQFTEFTPLGKSIDTFFSSAACIAPASPTMASQQGGSFLGSTDLISPCPLASVCVDFSNVALPSSSSGEPKQQRWPVLGFFEGSLESL